MGRWFSLFELHPYEERGLESQTMAHTLHKPRPTPPPTPPTALTEVAGQAVRLVCSDTTNLWAAANPWLTRFDDMVLKVTFLDLPGRPVLRFVPFERHGSTQHGMKIEGAPVARALWARLTARGNQSTPPTYQVAFEYEDLTR